MIQKVLAFEGFLFYNEMLECLFICVGLSSLIEKKFTKMNGGGVTSAILNSESGVSCLVGALCNRIKMTRRT